MEDEEREGESEPNSEEGFSTTSVLTISSSKFRKLVSFRQGDEEDEEENEGGFSEQIFENQQTSLNRIPEQQSNTVFDGMGNHFSVSTLISDGSRSKPITTPLEVSNSVDTVVEPEGGLAQQTQSLSKSKSEYKKVDVDHAHPFYYVELKRLRKTEKFDAFSDDEEPVLRTNFTPFAPKDPECPEPVIRMENIVIYNVREGKVPPKPRYKKRETRRGKSPSNSTALISRSSIARRSVRLEPSTRNAPLEWRYQDLTPHQRDLRNVSFEELSPVEVAIIKGLWKCITYNLWTFGALTTINFFRIRGHIAFNDQKATPEQIAKCRFLWPHANQAMKSMEAVVLNLHKPEKSHKLVYELGRKHGKLKIPLNETQSEMVVNSFLFTFYQHVHPKMTLKEINILRKFSNITMFLFMDSSRWDSEPLPLY